ncbi:tetratricopeptide repeat protein [Porphyromonas gingivalis]|uniref:tetratricopeptide repeat protein n=1 Tax=Porphyromonas gingivalis TaxID=837 RepID=UPI00102A5279|nr:tetratricopeptide repeat protein [Porphyromonas gingivalis]RZQ68952.1 tetratricopeptide repeat protein [Porphyromonas gingivalis]
MITTLGEYALKAAIKIGLNIHSFHRSEVDEQIRSAFEYAVNDWSKHDVGITTRINLKQALEAYAQNPTSFEAEDQEIRDFIACFEKRLAESKHQAAYNYLTRLENREQHTQIMATIKEKDLDTRDIERYLKRLPIKEGQAKADKAIEDLYQSQEIELCLRETLQIIVRNLFEHSAELLHEIEKLKKSGNTLLADTLESIRQVVIGKSDNSLTRIYEEYEEKRNEEFIKVLRELIEAAKTKFSFDEACNFYEKLIAIERSLKNLFGYADLLYSLNDFTKAKQYYEEVLNVYKERAKKDTETYNPSLAMTLNNLGLLLSDNNETKQAQVCYQEALEIKRDLAKKNPQAYNPDLAGTLNNLANLLSNNNEIKQAKDCYQEALKIYRDLAKKNPQAYNPDLAMTLNNLGLLLSNNNEIERAKDCYQEALDIRRALAKKNPQAYNPDLAGTLNNLANLLSNNNEIKQAKDCYQEALKIYRALAKKNPQAYNPDLASTLNNLGHLLRKKNEIERAKDCYQKALDIRRALAKKNPQAYNPYLALTLNNLGALFYKHNEPKQAKDCYQEALDIYRALAKKNPQAYNPDLAMTLNNLGLLLSNNNEIKQAQIYYQETLDIYRAFAKKNPQAYNPYLAMTLNNLAVFCNQINNREEAEKAYKGALSIREILAKRNPSAYEIDYLQTLIFGIDCLGKELKEIEQIKATLQKYPNNSQAIALLERIKSWEEENPNA